MKGWGLPFAIAFGNDLVAMRGNLIFCGLLMVTLLSGCSGGLANLSDLNLTQTGSLSEWAAEDDAEASEEEGIPLPVRNVRRAGVKTADAGQKQGGGLFSLPTLPDVEDLAAAPAEPSHVTQWKENPVGVYTVLARQIHSCWLNAKAPKLKNHGLHAEVASGNADTATIVIYKKDEQGRRGAQVFRIEIQSEFSGSSVEAKNRKLDKTQDFAFREDLVRWSRGDQQCAI